MKQLYILGLLVVFVMGCNPYKKAQKELLQGDYDTALNMMIEKYQKGLKDKNAEKYISLLQQAYLKANERDVELLKRLDASSAIDKYEQKYNTLLKIQKRQDKVKPLLPMNLKGSNVSFPMKDYVADIEKVKPLYVDELDYRSTLAKNEGTKKGYQNAYYFYTRIKELDPRFYDINHKIEEAQFYGTTFVILEIKNHADVVLPSRLEKELLAVDSYGLSKDWFVVDAQKRKDFQYDMAAVLNLDRMAVSPEQISQDRFVKEKDIVDGWEYLTNSQGNYVKDSLGNKIKVDKYKTVTVEVQELHQFKEAFITAELRIIDLQTQQLVDKEKFDSHFVFEDHSARIFGDERALPDDYFTNVKRNPVPMPPNEQMLYDCGRDLKNKMKSYLSRVFR